MRKILEKCLADSFLVKMSSRPTKEIPDLDTQLLIQFQCNGELRFPRFKIPPVLNHSWIRTSPVLGLPQSPVK